MVIILNGPPGSGKDALSRMIMPQLGVKQLEFKRPLQEMVRKVIGMPKKDFYKLYEDRDWKELKQFNGSSCRDLLIWMSEEVIKPKFGKDYFGRYAATSISSTGNYIFSDGGFKDEIGIIKDHCEAIGQKMVLIHLYRDGTSFSGDSRDYVEDFPEITYKLSNNSSLMDAVRILEGFFLK